MLPEKYRDVNEICKGSPWKTGQERDDLEKIPRCPDAVGVNANRDGTPQSGVKPPQSTKRVVRRVDMEARNSAWALILVGNTYAVINFHGWKVVAERGREIQSPHAQLGRLHCGGNANPCLSRFTPRAGRCAIGRSRSRNWRRARNSRSRTAAQEMPSRPAVSAVE